MSLRIAKWPVSTTTSAVAPHRHARSTRRRSAGWLAAAPPSSPTPPCPAAGVPPPCRPPSPPPGRHPSCPTATTRPPRPSGHGRRRASLCPLAEAPHLQPRAATCRGVRCGLRISKGGARGMGRGSGRRAGGNQAGARAGGRLCGCVAARACASVLRVWVVGAEKQAVGTEGHLECTWDSGPDPPGCIPTGGNKNLACTGKTDRAQAPPARPSPPPAAPESSRSCPLHTAPPALRGLAGAARRRDTHREGRTTRDPAVCRAPALRPPPSGPARRRVCHRCGLRGGRSAATRLRGGTRAV
jgi:hypothetical protein